VLLSNQAGTDAHCGPLLEQGFAGADPECMPADEKIKELRIWTDASVTNPVIKGIYILTSRNQQLDARQDLQRLLLTKADVIVKAPDLATGVLLGITAAQKDQTEVLSAISFNFLKVPNSSAISVDMPSINIDALEFKPQISIQSSTR
jgi:hypothetical protein